MNDLNTVIDKHNKTGENFGACQDAARLFLKKHCLAEGATDYTSRKAGLVLPEIPAHDVGLAASSEIVGLVTFSRGWEARYCPLPSRALFEQPTIEEQERRLRQALASPLASLGIAIRQSDAR